MKIPYVCLLPALLGLGACAALPNAPAIEGTPPTEIVQEPKRMYPPPQEPPRLSAQNATAAPYSPQSFERWRTGAPVLQGMFGISYIDKVERSGGSTSTVEVDSSQLPVLGGGGQWKLAGKRIDLGLEGLFDFSGRGNVSAFAAGGGGAAVAVDVDLWIFELYGGPFANVFLGDKCRAYVAAGPLLEWANYDQYHNGFSGSGSGFGSGWYARSGIEFATSPGMMVGVCVRWTDSTVDLGGSLGDLDIQGTQVLLTVSRGF